MANVSLAGYLHKASRNGPISAERIVDELELMGLRTTAADVAGELEAAGFADRGGVWLPSSAELERRLARAERLLGDAVEAATNMKGEAKPGAKLEILGAVDDVRRRHRAHFEGRED